MNEIYLLTFVTIIFCCAGISTGETAATCCEQEGLPSECHYLCRDEDASWQLEVQCAFYRAKLNFCESKGIGIDIVTLFGKDFKKTVENGWNKLTDGLKTALSTAETLARISVDQMKELHQDLLSGLHTLSGITSSQFKGLMSRFQDFTAENLRKVMERIDVNVILDNIKDLATYAWDRSQLAILAESAYKRFGENVEAWSSAQLEQLGNIIAGLTSSDFAKFSAKAFDGSLEKLCEAKVSFQQKLNLFVPAKSIFGQVSQWNSSTITRMCNFVEALTPEEILQMKADEISKALPNLQKQIFSKSQQQAILKKLKESWGDLSLWSTDNLKKLGNFVGSIDVNDIQHLDADKLKEIIKEYGTDAWDDVQKNEMLKQLIAKVDIPENWPEDILLKAIDLLKSVNTQELKKISKTLLIKALEQGKKVNWTQGQAEVLLQIVKGERTDFSALAKEEILKLASILKAFSQSDAGRFTKKVLFLAFPEFVPVVGLGEPVIRYFIKVYKEESKNGEIKTLGQFVKALTRYDLSQENIQDILANLEDMTNTDFDEAQIAELMIKLRAKLGNMNSTDSNDADIVPWGFQNLRKIGKIVLGFTRKELKELPIRGIEDSVEVLGKQDEWKRRMVLAMYSRVKEYWTTIGISTPQLNESNIEALGKFVQGLSLDELKSLKADAKKAAIEKLGEYTGLPEDKLKSRAHFAYNYLKNLNSGKVTSSDLKILGNLIPGLPREYIGQLDNDVITNNLPLILKNRDLSLDSLKEIFGKVKSYLKESDVGKWSVDQLRKLGIALKSLNIDDIKSFSKDTFDSIIDELGSIEWNEEQLKELVKKAKEKYGDDVSAWSEQVLHRLGSIMNGLSDSDIGKITKQAFENMIGQFGNGFELSQGVKNALAKKLKEFMLANDLSNLDVDLAKRFSNILSGISTDDLKNVNIDNLDFLDVLGNVKDWNLEQLKVLAKKARDFLSTQSVTDAYTSLKNLLKGFSNTDIENIPDEAFRYAAGMFGKVTGLSTDQKKELINKAKTAWGNDVSKWSAALITETGYFFDGMDSEDIKKVNPDHIPHILPAVFENMDNTQVQAFTVDQLSEFTEPQVNALSNEQKSGLTEPKMEALKSVQNEDPKDADPYGHTGSSIIYHVTTPVLLACFVVNVYLVWLF